MKGKGFCILALLLFFGGPWPAHQVSAVVNISVGLPEDNATCPTGLPAPQVKFTRTEAYELNGTKLIRYRLSVTNRDEYPDELFAPSPELPPCGLNTNSSRTWVDIDDVSGNYIYGFCALGTPDNLDLLWFSGYQGQQPPHDYVRVILNDRLCGTSYESEPVPIIALVPPKDASIYHYGQATTPVYDRDPANCKPMAVGNLAGGILQMKLGLPPFTGPVDLYMAIYAPQIDPLHVYLFVKENGNPILVPFSGDPNDLEAFDSGTTFPEQGLFGDIPVSSLPSGTYYLYVIVTPAGSLNAYYTWQTNFQIQ